MKKFILLVLSVIIVTAGAVGIRVHAQEAQQKLLPVRVAPLGIVSILRVPNWVAVNEGIYKKNGLDVDQCESEGDVKQLKSVAGIDLPAEYRCKPGRAPGTISIGGGLPTSFMSAFEINDAGTVQPRRVILGTVQTRTNYVMIAGKDITRPEQLHGKRIGVTSLYTIMGYQALLFAQAMGWEPGKDITIMQEPTGTMEGMEAGKYDAYIAGEGLPEWQATQKAGLKPLIDFKPWKIPMTSSSINADVDWLKDNRETARRFMKSMVEAIAMMKQDRRVAYRAMAKYYGITDPKMQAFMYGDYDTDIYFPAKPYPNVEGLRIAQKLYGTTFPTFGRLREDDLRKAKLEDYVDDSFIRELDQSGYIDSLYKKK